MKKCLAESSQPFLEYLENWLESVPAMPADHLFIQPDKIAIVAVDIINGFIRSGPLASERVAEIIPHVTQLLESAWQHGVTNILHATDSHEPDAFEFEAWPPHCIRGTKDSEPVDELKALPFAEKILRIPKNTIASGLAIEMEDWVIVHPEVETYIVVGDVTDLCVYQLAMYLRLEANARHEQRRVIVPQNCVQTYERTVATAKQEGGFAHDGDLLQMVFLYHLALNGIEVIKEVT